MMLPSDDHDEATRRLGRVLVYIISLAREAEAADADRVPGTQSAPVAEDSPDNKRWPA